MTRRSKIWLVVAVLFVLINAAGVVFAAARREVIHTSVHIGLLLLGAYGVWLLVPKRRARAPGQAGQGATPPLPRDLADRLTNLEQSVDAVAIEIERIGEGQRYITRRFTEHERSPAAGDGGSERTEREARDGPPDTPRD